MPIEVVDETEAYRLLERLRWPDGVPDRCPHCAAAAGAWFLSPADGRSRATSTGARSRRRVWRCRTCRRQFSVLTGTFLQGTRTPILTWLAVAADQASTRSVAHTADRFGLTADTVRHIRQRLAAAERALVTGSTGTSG